MKRLWLAVLALAPFEAAAADLAPSEAPYSLLDIRLGQTRGELGRQLDLRDIAAALAALQHAGRPDLGARGYGCMPRSDENADETCVSHDERYAGGATRELRLQFLDGVLQQASLTAEAVRYDELRAELESRYGAGRARVDGGSSWLEWRNAGGSLRMTRGPSLVFISLERAGYPAAVAAKRARLEAPPAPECR